MAFITFRCIYEWNETYTLNNIFEKSMGLHVLNGLKYNICEVYIENMLIFGSNDAAFVNDTRNVFQLCRKRHAEH